MKGLFDFLDNSMSPYHAVWEAEKKLEKHGFTELEETKIWDLKAGQGYFVTRNQSSIIAFRLPKQGIKSYHMTASHSDSPTFRIKKTQTENKYYAKAEVEGYGGMIMSSWFDRPLTAAGRVILRTEAGISAHRIAIDKDLFVIPNLAIHFNRELNSGYQYNLQTDLQPMYGDKGENLLDILKEEITADITGEIVDTDLVLSVRQKASYLGVKNEFYMSPRIDDLACAYSTLEGFLDASTDENTANIWSMFDNEEVGSGTRQGAMSGFLPEVLARIEAVYKMNREESACVRAASFLVSADNAHATHPNLPEKSDHEFPVILNHGIVIKYNASQKYTTTGMTAAVFEEVCKKREIMVQHFANRADSPGGSTLGNLLSHQVSIPMVDIGLPQLAMHSAVETAGCQDIADMKKAIQSFYESNICQVKDGAWTI